ncbi:hypothetical protein CPC08DRAFT_723770 [Agrocybe pediades]|nr:hypothetical protein CPC08DRAFT_723770 [Agrocybe pediades]
MKEEDDPEDESFREAVDYVVRSLETSTINKAAASVDLSVIERRISGLALKARINSQEIFGEALQTAYDKLKKNVEERENDLDQDIKASRLPDHLQFLLVLSRPPTEVTLMKAQTFLDNIANPPPTEHTLTWADILAEEPFEGEHWEGVYDQKDGGNWTSTPSLSPLSSDDRPLDDDDSSVEYGVPSSDSTTSEPPDRMDDSRPAKPYVPHSYENRKQFEELRARQYWRDDWHSDASPNPTFDINDPSTLGPTISRALAEATGMKDAQAMLRPEHYIDEVDMTREILMSLQGNNTTILRWNGIAFEMLPNAPRLVHLSLASQQSIIMSLARTASIVQNLRRFTATVFSASFANKQTNNRKVTTTRTCEAFADAIDEATRELDAWCAAREEAICRAYAGIDTEPLVVTLLETEGAIRDRYGTVFEVLLEIIQTIFQIRPGEDLSQFDLSATLLRQPAALTAQLLDTLFLNVQQHMERRDNITSDALTRVFLRTAGPIWSMVGKWLKDGMGLGLGVGSGRRPDMADELDEEFFIENNGLGSGIMGVGLLDPEFWQEGYALRERTTPSGEDGTEGQASGQSRSRRVIPLFLEHVADMVLSAGKAVGLMRALGAPLSSNVFDGRKTFADLVSSAALDGGEKSKALGLFSVSIDTLSRLIYDTLLPHCQNTGSQLVKVLVEDCFLWKHLQAIEDLFLMRKGEVIPHFMDVLFMKMDSNQPWGDFYFLNTAFSDVVEANLNAGGKEWINASLVRLSYRGSREKDRTIRRTVKAIDGLALEYAVPFPLTYIFQPKIIEGYSDIFVFLLQIHRAKNALERILVRDERGKDKQLKEELKVLYAMRSRLSWFIITLLNFLTTYVIHAEVMRFHTVFRQAESLDDMIRFHDEHLEKIRGRCLLKPNTTALHRAILSILDMCLHFGDGFVDFAGSSATLDLSRQSINVKRHRSRRQERQNRNVVSFSQNRDHEWSSDEDEDEEDIMDSEDGGRIKEPPEPSFSLGSSVMTQDEGFPARVGKMSSELDGLVRFIRRGVESLAGGTSEAGPAFGVLAFSLEDWDM